MHMYSVICTTLPTLPLSHNQVRQQNALHLLCNTLWTLPNRCADLDIPHWRVGGLIKGWHRDVPLWQGVAFTKVIQRVGVRAPISAAREDFTVLYLDTRGAQSRAHFCISVHDAVCRVEAILWGCRAVCLQCKERQGLLLLPLLLGFNGPATEAEPQIIIMRENEIHIWKGGGV